MRREKRKGKRKEEGKHNEKAKPDRVLICKWKGIQTLLKRRRADAANNSNFHIFKRLE